MRINYDFSNLIDSCYDVINNPKKASNCESLRKQLNKFFKDSTCTNITYTESDSYFFGMCVHPILDKVTIARILQNEDKVRFKKYAIEIDSKIFNPILDISPSELLAVLLHEVGHVINDPEPVERVRNAIAISLTRQNTVLHMPKAVQFYQILSYGIKDAVRKTSSIFFIHNDGEVCADEFVTMCGFGDQLDNFLIKLANNGYKIVDKENKNKLAALTWSLELYTNVKMRRIPCLRLLRKMHSITPSQFEKKEIEIIENALKSIDDNMLVEESYSYYAKDDECYSIFTESGSKIKTKYGELRQKISMRQIEDFNSDVYEYTMRIRHISTQEDALYMMRQINLRISVIEDYKRKDRIPSYELERINNILDKYYSLREELANKINYRYDYSGSVITVTYPEIVDKRY